MRRFVKLVNNKIYHLFNKSITNYKIFSDFQNSYRFYQNLCFYNNSENKDKLSNVLEKNLKISTNIFKNNQFSIAKIISYCIMPDYYHLLVKILKEDFFIFFIGRIENSFSRYFNEKYKRKGPLWQSRFKAVLIKNNEQLLHVSRYIHLNPTTSNLVEKPELWFFSSYKKYITNKNFFKEYLNEISIKDCLDYKKFVENRVDYQKKLKMIKKLIFD